MKNRVLAALLVLLTLSAPLPARAVETQPGDACTAGETHLVRQIGGPENPGTGYLLVCDGSTWKTVTQWETGTGNSLFEVGYDAGACNAVKEGRLRFSSSGDSWEYCHSNTWTVFGGGGSVALSDLTNATGANTLANGANAQTWNWDSITTTNGLAVGSTSITSGNIFSSTINRAASTGNAIFGTTNSTSTGTAIRGTATGTSGTNYGVYGSNASASGFGMFGYNSNSGIGVQGSSSGSGGIGIKGLAGSGVSVGVLGENGSTTNNAKAVQGTATGGSGTTYGVYGSSASTTGTGVYGTGQAAGIYGLMTGTGGGGYGVYGEANCPSCLSYGIYGRISSTLATSTAVYGYSSGATGGSYGVHGIADSTSGTGVFGYATAGSGTTYGTRGSVNSASGYGGYFVNTANGWGVYSEDDVGITAGKYLNWGTTRGSTGYGIRDNAGTIEIKNSGGSWAAPGGAETDPQVGTVTAGNLCIGTGTTVDCGDSNIGTKDDITTRVPSGVWQTSTATTAEGWPQTTNLWYHLLSTTHSNTGNYYAMQFAGSFYDSNLIYYRTTNNVGTAAWNKMWHEGNDGAGSGLDADTLDGLSSADLSSSGTSGYLQFSNGSGGFSNSGTTGGQQLFWDNTNKRLGIGTAAPIYPLDVQGNVAMGAGLYTGSGVSTADTSIELGGSRTGDGHSYIDFHTQNASDYDFRIIHYAGANTWTLLENPGAGGIRIFSGGATGLAVNSSGYTGVGTTSPQSLLQVDSSGYAQFSKLFAGAPTGTDCDAAAEAGRVTYDTTNNLWYVCEGAGGWTGVGGGGAALSGLTNATGTNTLANGANAQTWNWDSMTAGNGLAIGSTSITSGNILSATINRAASTGNAIYATTNTTSTGAAIMAKATGTSGANYGIWAETASTSGAAVEGKAASSTGGSTGVIGWATSSSGVGVAGAATSATGLTYGVTGRSDSSTGVGVYGLLTHASATGSAVLGQTSSTSGGSAVAGNATGASGTVVGVYGSAASSSGVAVQGVATHGTGTVYGGSFSATSSSGSGIYTTGGYSGLQGYSTNTSGAAYGVFGTSASSSGYGGYFDNTNGGGGWALYAADDTGIASDKYLNWGATRGTSGYGIRDNSGTMQWKNSGGSWANFGGGASLSGLTAATGSNTIANGANTQTWNWDSLAGSNGLVIGSSNLNGGRLLSVNVTDTSATGSAIYATTADGSGGSAIEAVATATTGNVLAVEAWTSSTAGTGVYGEATATTGTTYGVRGIAASTSGYGGYFSNTGSTSGTGAYGYGKLYGLYGTTDFSNGAGVFGYNSLSVSSNGYGVYGLSDNQNGGKGVAGSATGSGGTMGVYGTSSSTSGYGVYGLNSNATAGSYGIYCSSGRSAGCGGNQNWTNASDMRLKERIADLPDERGLDAIMKLRPVTYHWKDKKLDEGNGQRIGLIAQDVETVFPESVGVGNKTEIDLGDGKTETVENTKNLAYSDLVVPLIKAVQQQQDQIETQQAQVDDLKAANDNLRQEIERLKAAR